MKNTRLPTLDLSDLSALIGRPVECLQVRYHEWDGLEAGRYAKAKDGSLWRLEDVEGIDISENGRSDRILVTARVAHLVEQ
jgi:hypothetical protein